MVLCQNCTECGKDKKAKKKKKKFEEKQPHLINLKDIVQKEDDTLNNYLYFYHKKQLDLKKLFKGDSKEQKPKIRVSYPDEPISVKKVLNVEDLKEKEKVQAKGSVSGEIKNQLFFPEEAQSVKQTQSIDLPKNKPEEVEKKEELN